MTIIKNPLDKPFNQASYNENDPMTKEMMKYVLQKAEGHTVLDNDNTEYYKVCDVPSYNKKEDKVYFNEGAHRKKWWDFIKEGASNDPDFSIYVWARKNRLGDGFYYEYSPDWREYYRFRTEEIKAHGKPVTRYNVDRDGKPGCDRSYKIPARCVQWFRITDDGEIEEFTP